MGQLTGPNQSIDLTAFIQLPVLSIVKSTKPEHGIKGGLITTTTVLASINSHRHGSQYSSFRHPFFFLKFVPSHDHRDSGDHGGGATPVPIPNTAVKPSCADDTAHKRESRLSPG